MLDYECLSFHTSFKHFSHIGIYILFFNLLLKSLSWVEEVTSTWDVEIERGRFFIPIITVVIFSFWGLIYHLFRKENNQYISCWESKICGYDISFSVSFNHFEKNIWVFLISDDGLKCDTEFKSSFHLTTKRFCSTLQGTIADVVDDLRIMFLYNLWSIGTNISV